jgi:hypothetical protein
MGSTPALREILLGRRSDVDTFSNAPTLLAQTVTFFSVATFVVAGRCYVRAVMLKAFGKDDWTILLATVSNTPLDLPINRF